MSGENTGAQFSRSLRAIMGISLAGGESPRPISETQYSAIQPLKASQFAVTSSAAKVAKGLRAPSREG